MRAYFFGNMYLSQIQQGIQAAHVLAEMWVKWGDPVFTQYTDLKEWAENHKTMILLNAGYSSEIESLVEYFNRQNPYPWASFNEDPRALGLGYDDIGQKGALTCAGIILPERIYETARIIRSWRPRHNQPWTDGPMHEIETKGHLTIRPANEYGYETEEKIVWEYTKWEYDLAHRLNQYRLA